MPFEAARAVAATFCWNIRYALIPLFGPDFIKLCRQESSDQFGQMAIDPEIVRKCARDAQEYLELYARPRRPRLVESSIQSHWQHQSGHPISPVDSEVECTVDGDHGPGLADSPASTCSCHWSPPTPRSMKDDMILPSPRQILAVTAPSTPSAYSGLHSSPKASPLTHRRSFTQDSGQFLEHLIKTSDGDDDAWKSRFRERDTADHGSQAPRETPIPPQNKETAAHLLMQLYLADTGPSTEDDQSSPKKRRASG